MMQETMEKKSKQNRRKEPSKGLFCGSSFFLSAAVYLQQCSAGRAGKNGGNHCARIRQDSPDAKWKRRPNDDRGSVSDRRAGGGDSCRI